MKDKWRLSPLDGGVTGPTGRAAWSSLEWPLAFTVILFALVLRLHNIRFGLPSLYDPDEPLFVVKAAALLKNRTLDPHWFGHPASTTIYVTALVQAGVYLTGVLAGRFSGLADFIRAAYADPGVVFYPVRVVMALLGAGSVALTYLLARRLFGTSAALIAAMLLALNGLHIGWSQVIRSDVQASDFMLGALLIACRLAETGSRKDAIWAGILTGFAIATKWPAATAFAGVVGAALLCQRSRDLSLVTSAKSIVLSGLAVIAGLFIASPFLFIDYQTVLSNLAGEARLFHVGHTGNGFFSNLSVYVGGFGVSSMGWLGILLAAAGAIVFSVRSAKVRYILVPATIAFFISISAPPLIWSRWLVPGLPYLAIFASAAIIYLAKLLSRGHPRAREMIVAILAAVAIAPSAIGAVGQARERETDTRSQAAQWIVTHARPGSTIVLEHLELSLRKQPFGVLFPLGERGCQDGRALLNSGIDDNGIQHARGASPVVDLGNVNPAKIGSCRADYAILNYYDEYLREPQRYPQEVATYAKILAGGRTVAMFHPEQGRVGGPLVRIVALPPRPAANARPKD